MKKCPFCAEEIQDEAIKCKHCGEMVEVAAQRSPPPSSTRTSGKPFVKVVGLLLLLIGLGTLLYFLMLYDTGVDVPTVNVMGQEIGGGKVHNIGLMQNRQNGIILGSVVAVAGFGCLLVGLYARGNVSAVPESEARLGLTRNAVFVLAVIGFALAVIFVAMKYMDDIKKLNQ